MRRLSGVLLLLLLAAGAVAVWAWQRSRDLRWATGSAAALTALEAGHAAYMKLYFVEAANHFRDALEADPNLVVAKIWLAGITDDREERQRLRADLASEDGVRLRPRERFLLEYHNLRSEGRGGEASTRLAEYLERRPNDPYVLSLACNETWTAQDFDRALELNRRLLEVDPNWVQAQNHLGYLEMARGRFQEAERQFETYAYLAPDQPNPHDSMAELFLLTGRYDEARVQLERALHLRPDFCASYPHLMQAALLSLDFESHPGLLDRTAAHCTPELTSALACSMAAWQAARDRVPAEVWDHIPDDCREAATSIGDDIFVRAALAAGHRELYEAMMDGLVQRYADSTKGGDSARNLQAIRGHWMGIDAFAQGRPEEALEFLQEADHHFAYWGEGVGLLKLANRVSIARVQEALGDGAAAAAQLEAVAAVNPQFLDIGEQVPLYGDWP